MLTLGIVAQGLAGYGNDFVFTVETTGASEPVTIRCQNVDTLNATTDWGDGGAISPINT